MVDKKDRDIYADSRYLSIEIAEKLPKQGSMHVITVHCIGLARADFDNG